MNQDSLDGWRLWFLVHIEVQSQHDTDLSRRMFVYFYRLFDKYNGREIVSLAILGDAHAKWQMAPYVRSWEGGHIECCPGVVRLLDLEAELQDRAQAGSPFALIALAHLATQRTTPEEPDRMIGKLRLLRHLYDVGADRELIRRAFRLLDWLMKLSPELELDLQRQLHEM
ncbi:MAG: hypothetical protein KDA99_14810, partial [Planctomycetales bacterium]|nr:hypothetical protein [Planctomycetales bacterium]